MLPTPLSCVDHQTNPNLVLCLVPGEECCEALALLLLPMLMCVDDRVNYGVGACADCTDAH